MRANGIKVPFPQRDLNLRDTEAMRDLIDAVRGRQGSDEAG
jgi:small-conductance mechanosensitive channel